MFICCLIRPQCHELLTPPLSGPNGALDDGPLIQSEDTYIRTLV